MDGAFTLWDPLLSRLVESHHTLPAALVQRLQAQLTESTVQSSKDVTSEAFALWLLHALEFSNTYAAHGSTDASLQAATLRTCCLYPGHWTTMVGQRLLDRDAELIADYQALFEASLLVANSEVMEEDTEVGAAIDGGPSELPISTRDELVAAKPLALLDDSTAAVGWRRALFAPCVPIGIVA